MVKDREEVNSISSALHFNLYLSQKSEVICTIFRISKNSNLTSLEKLENTMTQGMCYYTVTISYS